MDLNKLIELYKLNDLAADFVQDYDLSLLKGRYVSELLSEFVNSRLPITLGEALQDIEDLDIDYLDDAVKFNTSFFDVLCDALMQYKSDRIYENIHGLLCAWVSLYLGEKVDAYDVDGIADFLEGDNEIDPSQFEAYKCE